MEQWLEELAVLKEVFIIENILPSMSLGYVPGIQKLKFIYSKIVH